MLLKDVMTQNPITVSADANLSDAAREMDQRNIGSLPVVEDGKLAGIITDRDIVVRGLAQGKSLERIPIHLCMTKDVESCFEDQDIRAALKLMQAKKVGRVPVVDRDRRVVGMVSLAHLARASKDQMVRDEIFETLSEPRAGAGASWRQSPSASASAAI